MTLDVQLEFDDGKVWHRWPLPGSLITPCCGLTVPQLPDDECVTLNPAKVTCKGRV